MNRTALAAAFAPFAHFFTVASKVSNKNALEFSVCAAGVEANLTRADFERAADAFAGLSDAAPASVSQVDEIRFARLVRDFREHAQESGAVELSGSTFYFYGSEVATLRLLKQYRHCDPAKHRAEFSKNLGVHFFALDCPTLAGSFRVEAGADVCRRGRLTPPEIAPMPKEKTAGKTWTETEKNRFTSTEGGREIAVCREADGFWHLYVTDEDTAETWPASSSRTVAMREARIYAKRLAKASVAVVSPDRPVSQS